MCGCCKWIHKAHKPNYTLHRSTNFIQVIRCVELWYQSLSRTVSSSAVITSVVITCSYDISRYYVQFCYQSLSHAVMISVISTCSVISAVKLTTEHKSYPWPGQMNHGDVLLSNQHHLSPSREQSLSSIHCWSKFTPLWVYLEIRYSPLAHLP